MKKIRISDIIITEAFANSYPSEEEAYTSGTSFLDDELPIKENYNKSRRIYRGLFKEI